jgi:hypothetical protein
LQSSLRINQKAQEKLKLATENTGKLPKLHENSLKRATTQSVAVIEAETVKDFHPLEFSDARLDF